MTDSSVLGHTPVLAALSSGSRSSSRSWSRGGRALSRRAEAAVLLALGLSGCATTLETKTLLDLDCGGVKLRFAEPILSDRIFGNIIGSSPRSILVLIEKGGSWVEVDAFYHGGDMSGFLRLLPPDLAYRGFPFDEQRKQDDSYWGRSHWTVFASPAVVGPQEYETVAACLGAHIKEIDDAFATRPGEGSIEFQSRRRPQIVGIVRSTWDPEYADCGTKTAGRRWVCGNGEGYVKTVVGDSWPFILCTTEPPPVETHVVDGLEIKMSETTGMGVGSGAKDESAVFLVPPDPLYYEYQKLLKGRDAKAYYATCRDAHGRAFFEEFEPFDHPDP